MLRGVSKLLGVPVLLLCCLGRGQDIRIDIPYQRFVLSNGLTVIVFNGSEHFKQDYFKVLEKLGATDLNGTTNYDALCVRLPAK